MNNPFKRALLETRFGAVHYWSGGTGPAVLMLHQSAQSSDEFLQFAVHLADDYTVVSLDHPGHGISDTPDHELSVEEYGEAALAALDALELGKVSLVAHHGGCMLAAYLATHDPERIDRVVLSGGGYPDPAVADKLLNQPMSRDYPMDADGEFVARTWDVYRGMTSPGIPPEVTFLPFTVGLRARLRPYDMHFAVLQWDYGTVVRRMQQPTLLIRAEHDVFAGDVAGLHADLPNSEYVEIAGGGPWLFYEQPEACAREISRFFSR